MKHYKYTLCALMGLALLVSGCDGYNTNFKPDQVAWAKNPGNKTLAVQVVGNDGLHQALQCNVAEKDVMLLPDTKFYRNYLRVDLAQVGFKEKLGHQAEPLVRRVSLGSGCRLVFNNLPEGNWLLVIRPQFSIHDDAAAQSGGRSQYNVVPPAFVWSALALSPESDVTTRQVEVDISRLARRKHPHLHKHISKHSQKRLREFHGEGSLNTRVEDWTPTLSDRQELGLPSSVKTIGQ